MCGSTLVGATVGIVGNDDDDDDDDDDDGVRFGCAD